MVDANGVGTNDVVGPAARFELSGVDLNLMSIKRSIELYLPYEAGHLPLVGTGLTARQNAIRGAGPRRDHPRLHRVVLGGLIGIAGS